MSERQTPPDAALGAVPSGGTSRRLVLAGTGAGALLALGVRGPATAAASAFTTGNLPVGGSTRSLPLRAAAAGRGGARLLSSGVGGDALSIVSVEVSGGSMLGVTFPDGTSTPAVAVRVRRAGVWSEWTELPLHDSEPDPGTVDAHTSVVGSDPLWVGELGTSATVEVQLRESDVASAHLEVIDPGARSTERAVSLLAGPEDATADATVAADLAVDTKAVAQPRIRSRAEWGADESIRKGQPSYSGTLKACVVHHTADGGSYSQAEVPAVIRGMYRYHAVSLGWSDLGYNFVVDRFGGIWEGRAGGITRPVVGAHAGGFNTDTFGVSMMGDFTGYAPPAAMIESVAQVIAWKLNLYGLPATGTARLVSAGGGTARFSAGTTANLRIVNAHRDVGFTACPGNTGFTRMDAIRARVAAIMGSAGSPVSAVAAKYAAVGGAAALGAPTGGEGEARAGGRYQHFGVGSIYWNNSVGAHVVKGIIRDKWRSMGWEASFLGFPTTDEVALRGGAFNHFTGGSIYYSPRTGARVVRGVIRDKWASTGWENGVLGFPTTDEGPLRGGAFNHFTGGSIYWSPRTGARVVRGFIRDRWAALGWEAGRLGFPTSDEYGVPEGRRSDFQGGSITWNSRTGAITVVGA